MLDTLDFVEVGILFGSCIGYVSSSVIGFFQPYIRHEITTKLFIIIYNAKIEHGDLGRLRYRF